MLYVSDENQYQALLQQQLCAVKVTYAGDRFVDAWVTEQAGVAETASIHNVSLSVTANGVSGVISLPLSTGAEDMEKVVMQAYLAVFSAMEAYSAYTIIRFWNYLPAIVSRVNETETVYHWFNAGRQAAFKTYYGERMGAMPVPAASAVGVAGNVLTVTFMAVTTPLVQIENKDQVPAFQYSSRYGQVAPFFSRGVVFNNQGQRLLLSSGTASIKGEHSLHEGDVHDQLYESIHNLRILGSQFNLKQYNIHYGFALEDIVHMRVYYKHEHDRAFLERFVPRFLSPACVVSFVQAAICREELLVELEALYVKKGETEQGVTPKYVLEGDLIRTESFEVHVAEHCNLKCRDCCNISPFNAKKFMSIEEITNICAFVKTHLRPDVFKVAGGEPTLHPQLDELLLVIKSSGAAPVVRVVSNGLLLHRMSNVFWENIDQLTISHYISAPMKANLLQQVKDKAREYEVVLNIKYVEQFNEIFVEDAITDKERVQEIYNDCWMRHRCLIVRNGTFYKCTRASYMNEFLHMKNKPVQTTSSTYSEEDGIPVNDPAFAAKALEYLNAAVPLQSCEYCLGVSGNLRENIQMKSIK
ncbi:4Fe-4S single cluster domain-containing protein [Filimonas lacunae]|uniref:4Fe-4S single cluster domain-containing protein n=1 Tax=Filimonas lacunae TaxID=477680 RepID=A0A173MMF7_9BACT|nr:radical SAM protein [Filimonas lacunae]BAV08667.1 pteridine-dependent dioxygenase [Filimonas lacunae]SIS59621.1 4Fe-4S single cluster domain-containing protein [Filimonas lacunae]